MNATSLYVSTCRLVLQANPEDPGCWTDLYRLIPYLRQSLSCTVCGNLLIEPYTPTETNCQHHVCRTCKGGKKKLKPSCSWCKNYEKYIENVQLRILLQCYKKLCEYIINSSMYRLMCKSTASSSLGDANIANMTDLIQEGAGFKDEFKSNTGLSKSAYSILPCIYASASTQTITQVAGLNNETENTVDEDISVTKSNLSNGSSIYSVTYAGSGNKMVIKRKAMLNKGEMENCENLRLIKGTNFKRPIHRRGNFRGRGRAFKEEEKGNNTVINNCSVNFNNVNSGRVNVKKKKLGCRCGNATASPGKLTCCGQRCPCYVDSKACLDCKCRGCRNPHTKEGQKVIREPLDSTNSKIQPSAHLQTDDGIPGRQTNSVSDVRGDESLKQPKEIVITVEEIENIDTSKVKDIMVRIEYCGNVLAESDSIPINSSERTRIRLYGYITAEDLSPQFLDQLLANPALFTVVDCTRPPSSSPRSQSSKMDNPKRKQIKTPTSSVSMSLGGNSNVLGMCNLDLSELVMGKKEINRSLIIYPAGKKALPEEVVTWVKLPKLMVAASCGEEFLVPDSLSKCNNIVGVTIESVYNIPDNIKQGTLLEATIPMPFLGDKNNTLVFPNGVVSLMKDSNCKKKWLTLLHLEGQAGKSEYSISPYACDIINTVPDLVLEKKLQQVQEVIQWNTWRNAFMLKSDCNYFYSKLMKYRTWPVEIGISSKQGIGNVQRGTKSDKKSKPTTSTGHSFSEHYVAFLDISPLLYPGVTKARIAAQLFTYSKTDLLNKFGIDFPVTFSQASVVTVKSKGTERSKASVREPEDKKDPPGVPVFNYEGDPVFIVVEIELFKPLTPKKDPEVLFKELWSHVSLKTKVNKRTMNLALAQENYSDAIKNIASILATEYQNFSLELKKKATQPADFDVAFHEFLSLQENFQKMKTTLESKVINLINEKFGIMTNFNERIPEIFIYLVEQMHKAVNGCVLEQRGSPVTHCNTNELLLYAEEAIEEEEYGLAKDYMLLRLSRNLAKAEYWFDCAVFFIKMKNHETALELVREGLGLDPSHQIGLLMYGLLMAKFNNANIAELAFQVLLSKYPDFVEGWMVLRFFYKIFNNYEGEFVAHQMALQTEHQRQQTEKSSAEELSEAPSEDFCLKTFPRKNTNTNESERKYGIASFIKGKSTTDPLSWSISFCPPDNLNINTTVLMLRLGFYEYASVGLAHEMIVDAESNIPHHLYYHSVNHYLQGQYEEAISPLEIFVKEFGKDCLIWTVMGHCLYKMGNHMSAIACYEYVMESYNRPDDIHLIYLRMGSYYLKAKKYQCAKNVFLTACKYSPTPRLWKGAGIACLRMQEAEDAEISFTEASCLDNNDPTIWAYLALTNALLRRFHMFKHCYSEAKKRNLNNKELIEEIESCAESNGLKGEVL